MGLPTDGGSSKCSPHGDVFRPPGARSAPCGDPARNSGFDLSTVRSSGFNSLEPDVLQIQSVTEAAPTASNVRTLIFYSWPLRFTPCAAWDSAPLCLDS